MATDFDEYDYLEQQIEKKDTPKSEGKKSDLAEEDGSKKEERRRSEKSGKNDRDRSRDRDRDRDRDRSSRKHRSRSRSRDKGRDKDRDRHRSKDRDRDRGRDSERDRERDKNGYRSRSRDHKEPERERTPPEVRAQRERQRELEELERDTRTVFAYNLNTKATDFDIFDFFSKAGKVMDVRIITDRNTKRSKGFAYIEMSNKAEVAAALGLTGQVLMGQAVMVKASEAEKNMAWEAQQANQQANNMQMSTAVFPGMNTGPCKLQVSNVHPNVADSDLESIFSPFGALDFAQIVKDPSGSSTGAGIVQYKSASDALRAVQQLHNLEIAGLKIQVTVAPAAPAVNMAAATTNVSELDEEADGGFKMTAQSRAALMQRLSGSAAPSVGSGANTTPLGPPPAAMASGAVGAATPTPPKPSNPLAYEQGILGPSSPIPTQCLVLKNMFDPATETEPDWDVEIGEDVKEECSKYGAVLHHYVDKTSKGFVYLKFNATEAAQKAQMALNGRWFAGREVLAEYQFAAVYDSHFKL